MQCSSDTIFCLYNRLYVYIPELLGLSYIIFRVLSVILSVQDTGRLPGLVPYLNYCLSMFTFLSGPIQRYRDFDEDIVRRRTFRLGEGELSLGLNRILNGVLKVVYLAPVIQGLQEFFMTAREPGNFAIIRGPRSAIFHGPLDFSGTFAPSLGFGLAALSYLVFLYFNFSGYTDIVIGLGRLVGFRLPENFYKPFSSTNFLEFWRRWHISLSLWFRDYCFSPILKRMGENGN